MSASSNDVEEISTLYNRIWDEYFKKLFSRKIHTKIIMIGLLFGFTIPLLLQINRTPCQGHFRKLGLDF